MADTLPMPEELHWPAVEPLLEDGISQALLMEMTTPKLYPDEASGCKDLPCTSIAEAAGTTSSTSTKMRPQQLPCHLFNPQPKADQKAHHLSCHLLNPQPKADRKAHHLPCHVLNLQPKADRKAHHLPCHLLNLQPKADRKAHHLSLPLSEPVLPQSPRLILTPLLTLVWRKT